LPIRAKDYTSVALVNVSVAVQLIAGFEVSINCRFWVSTEAMKPIEFLTREGCVQTITMRSRLDEAVKGMNKPLTYTVVDLDVLPNTDPRKAYPTPSVLYGAVDLFGMAEPKPPYPEPT
jgi:hypothetical protein